MITIRQKCLTLLMIVVLLSLLVPYVSGHGRLMEPPSRGSMWRQGFPSPINYADNQLFCGGFKHQWEDQDGRCGVCGDPYDGPRDHEPGGQYYTGITTRTYKRGQIIDVEVELTAFHYGYFEFRLCPLEYLNQTVAQSCFDQYALKVATPSKSGVRTRYKLPDDPSIRMVKVKVALPPAVSCEQCILQWKYHAANSWGQDTRTGVGCVGCGAQEEFYGCADVKILPAAGAAINSKNVKYAKSIKMSSQAKVNRVIKDGDSKQQDDWSSSRQLWRPPGMPWTNYQSQGSWFGKSSNSKKYMDAEPKSLSSLKKMKATLVGNCYATGPWKKQAAMDDWCEVNCARGYCPKSHCLCTGGTPIQEGTHPSYPREPFGAPVPSKRGWSPLTYQGPNNRNGNSSPRGLGNYRWESPQSRPMHQFSSSSGSGRRNFNRFRNQDRAHNDYWSGQNTGGSENQYRSSGNQYYPPSSSSDNPSSSDMQDILAYSQDTFNSIRDRAEAAYRSFTGKDVPDYPDNIYGDSLYMPSRKYGRDYYKADGFGLTAHVHPKNPSYKPQGRSFDRYRKTGVNYHSEPTYPSEHGSYSGHRSLGFHDNSDADLIAKARFVDDRSSRAPTVRRTPNAKMAAPIARSGGDSRAGSVHHNDGTNCVANGAWTGQVAMTKWCQTNCALGNCPSTHCKCV